MRSRHPAAFNNERDIARARSRKVSPTMALRACVRRRAVRLTSSRRDSACRPAHYVDSL